RVFTSALKHNGRPFYGAATTLSAYPRATALRRAASASSRLPNGPMRTRNNSAPEPVRLTSIAAWPAPLTAVCTRCALSTSVNACGAVAFDAEHLCRAMREIEHAIGDKRTTVVDAHDHFASIFKVGDLHQARDRQSRMRSGDRFLIVHLPARGAPAMEGGAIP